MGVAFKNACPATQATFITTVTSMNIHEMDALVTFGSILACVNSSCPDNDEAARSKIRVLLLKQDDFSQMKQGLMARFDTQAGFDFADAPFIDKALGKMKADSFR